MEKAWAFYRRSTDKQELSIEDQKRDCHAFADLKGWQIVKEFSPQRGYASGLTIDRDAVFQQMVSSAIRGDHGVKYLIVYDVSRFGRLQPEDKIFWERRFFKDGGIQLVYVKDDFKNDGSIGDVLSKVVKHSEAHQFSMKLSELTLRGAKSHAALGHSAGGDAPFGYDRLLIDANGNPDRVLRRGQHKADKLQRVIWTPSPTDSLILREIFESYAGGKGLNTIINELNERGIHAPRKKYWTKSQLHYLLRNRAYLGERAYNKRSYKAYRRGEKGNLFNPPTDWVVTKNAHPPLIDEVLFNQIQSRFKVRGFSKGRNHHVSHLLSGMVVCGECGYRFTGWSKPKNYYSCSGYHRGGKGICRSVHVSGDELEQLALDAIRALLQNPNWKKELKPTLQKLIDEQFGDSAETSVIDLKKGLLAIEDQIANIMNAIKQGIFSPSVKGELDQLESQKRETEEALKRYGSIGQAKSQVDQICDQVSALADDFDDLWNNFSTNDERKAFLKAFIYQITVKHTAESIDAFYYLYRLPQSPENRLPRSTVSSTPGLLSLKSIAGVGFEPTTFGL